MQWARECLEGSFENVIWSDETTSNRNTLLILLGQKPKSKPHPKHPVKVYVWSGISWQGATKTCIFEGIISIF